jgi:hypothetical protein
MRAVDSGMRRPWAALVLVSLALAAPIDAARAQAAPGNRHDAGRDVQGTVRPPGRFDLVLAPADSAHGSAVRARLRALLDVLLAGTALSPPAGFDLQPTLIARTPIRPGEKGGPIQYEVTGHVHWYAWQPGIGRVAPTPVGMAAVYVTGNNLSIALQRNDRWADDPARELFWEPEEVGRVGGFPLFQGPSKRVVLVSDNGRPFWIPATRGQILEKMIAASKKYGPDARACLERELAALSPAERGQVAYLTVASSIPNAARGRCAPFVDPGARGARRIVRANTDFFDRSLPRTALQVIAVHTSDNERGRGWRKDALVRVRDGVDYAALSAMLGEP